jgi:HEAT repeat protein
LLGLAREVGRLLGAGAAAAAGHPGLARRAAALREPARGVPVLAAVAAAVERLTAAPGKQAAPALLDLALLTRQLRASLAAAGAEGRAEPPSASGPWQSPGAAADVYPAYEALTRSGSGGREEALGDAIRRNRVGDLRLVSALLEGLEDGSSGLAGRVAEEALPAVGKAVVPDLAARLNLRGKAADARRLLAVCKIDPLRGADLCRRALAEGSPALRVEALKRLPEVGKPGEAEKAGLALCRDRNGDVRQAALSALRVAKSDAALDALLAALEEKDWAALRTARFALAELPHPQATARLVQGLNARVAELPPKVPGKGGKKAAAAKAAARRDELISVIELYIDALGGRQDRKAAAEALLPLARHSEEQLRMAALTALGQLGAVTAEVVPTLAEALSDREPAVAEAAADALGNLAPEQREPALPAVLKRLEDPKLHEDVAPPLLFLLPAHVKHSGPAVLGCLRAHLKSTEFWAVDAVESALAEIGPAARPLLPDLLGQLRAGPNDWNYPHLFAAVEPDGATAVPAVLEMLRNGKPIVKVNALQVLARYGPRARAAEAAVGALLKDRSATVKEFARDALESIRGGA